MSASERDLLVFHIAFAGLAVGALTLAPSGGAGPWLLAVVLVYHGGSFAVTWQRERAEWAATWRFAALLSVWMVLPDAVLVNGLGVLDFPPDGVPDILGVTLPMAGMWAVPAVVIVSVADAVTRRGGHRRGYLAAGLTALVIFGGAEAALTLVPVWEPVGVTTVGGFAPYILPAEVVLAGMIVAGARWCRGAGALMQLAVTGLIALAYTGAATVSWLLIEHAWLATAA